MTRGEVVMNAAVVKAFKEGLVIEDRPIPEPGAGQVLVKIEASGLCHTDIHAANGDWPVKPTPPFVPGHEGVGIVERVGGDRERPGGAGRLSTHRQGRGRRWVARALVVRRAPIRISSRGVCPPR